MQFVKDFTNIVNENEQIKLFIDKKSSIVSEDQTIYCGETNAAAMNTLVRSNIRYFSVQLYFIKIGCQPGIRNFKPPVLLMIVSHAGCPANAQSGKTVPSAPHYPRLTHIETGKRHELLVFQIIDINNCAAGHAEILQTGI